MKRAVRRERYANRKRGRVTFGADASTAVFDVFETGMNVGQGDPMKWVILGITACPTSATCSTQIAADAERCVFQLCIGEQTTILNNDDMQCVSQAIRVHDIATSGGVNFDFPIVFPILSPIPVFSHQMTFGIVAVNNAAWNSVAVVYEIWYVVAPIQQDEIVEYLAAFGQI